MCWHVVVITIISIMIVVVVIISVITVVVAIILVMIAILASHVLLQLVGRKLLHLQVFIKEINIPS